MDVSSAAAYSMNKAQADVQQQVGISMLKKSMESSTMQMDALLEIMPQSVNPNVGTQLDVRG